VRLNHDIHGSTFTCFAGNVVVSIAFCAILADPTKRTVQNRYTTAVHSAGYRLWTNEKQCGLHCCSCPIGHN